MFSQLFTAAKGLLHRQQPAEQRATAADTRNRSRLSHIDSTTNSNTKMVTATRRGVVAAKTADISSVDVSDSGNVKVNGKRKTRPTSAGKSESTTSTSKRRKRQIPEDEHHTTIKSDTVNESATAELAENNVSAASSGKHMRFGSEAPDVPLEPQPEEEPVLQTAADRYEDEDDSDSDDEAPETIDNSAQLVKIKAEAKKLEIAKSM